MKQISYKTKGTCSQMINLTINDDNKIEEIEIIGGCNGNLKGIKSLITGMDANEAASKLEGITCGFKNTSCPDQISKAIKQALAQ